MKTKSTLNSIAIMLSFMLCVAQVSAATVTPMDARGDDNRRKATKKAVAYVSRNNHAVRIYPDPVKRVMHVIAKEKEGKPIDFFVFDLEGTLIQHYRMGSGAHEKLANL